MEHSKVIISVIPRRQQSIQADQPDARGPSTSLGMTERMKQYRTPHICTISNRRRKRTVAAIPPAKQSCRHRGGARRSRPIYCGKRLVAGIEQQSPVHSATMCVTHQQRHSGSRICPMTRSLRMPEIVILPVTTGMEHRLSSASNSSSGVANVDCGVAGRPIPAADGGYASTTSHDWCVGSNGGAFSAVEVLTRACPGECSGGRAIAAEAGIIGVWNFAGRISVNIRRI